MAQRVMRCVRNLRILASHRGGGGTYLSIITRLNPKKIRRECPIEIEFSVPLEREKPCTLKDYASLEAYTGRVHLTHNPDTSTPVTSSYFAQSPQASRL